MDAPLASENLLEFQKKEPSLKVIPICAELGEGVEEIKKFLKEQLTLMQNTHAITEVGLS